MKVVAKAMPNRVRPRVYVALQARARGDDGKWIVPRGGGASLTVEWDERRDGPVDVRALRDQIRFLLSTNGMSKRDCT